MRITNDGESTIPEFGAVVALLLNDEEPFPPALWNYFSDMSSVELDLLKTKWDLVKPEKKVALMDDLASMMDYNFQVSFDDFAKFCLNDEDSLVRAAAIRLLLEYSGRDLVAPMLDMLENDSDEVVQSTAATMLGNYVYLGELEEFPAKDARRVEDALLAAIADSSSTLVQRRALEAVSASSREEIEPLILAAYEKKEKEWQLTALFSMGRSADALWGRYVLENLDSEDSDILFEAVQAAGEIGLEQARKPLLELAARAEDLDQYVRMALAHSLENIGGKGVQAALEHLMELAEDDEEEEMIEQALEFTSFTEGVRSSPEMFGFSLEDFQDAMGELMAEEEGGSDYHSHAGHSHHHDEDEYYDEDALDFDDMDDELLDDIDDEDDDSLKPAASNKDKKRHRH